MLGVVHGVVQGVVRDLRSPRSLADPEQAAAYQEHLLAEFALARLAHGVADTTIRGELAAMEQFLAFAGVWVWQIQPAHADRFLGQDQRARASETRRWKAGAIDLFFRFVQARYRGELHELTGVLVTSPIDQANRPRHTGDFTVRVPPSPAALTAFFTAWRGELATTRKWLTAARHYAMARLAGEVGLRLRELCSLGLGDVHFAHGPLGKLHVRAGKGARGSGPRQRLVPLLGVMPARCWSGGSARSGGSSATTGSCPGRRCFRPSGAARLPVTASRPRSARPPGGTCAGRSPRSARTCCAMPARRAGMPRG